jgi:HEAT repeat protein
MARAYLHELGWSDQAAPLGSDLAEGVGHVEFGFVQQVLSTGRRVPDPVLDGVAARLGREKDAALLVKEIAFLGSHRHAKARPALRPLLAHPNEAVARAAFDVLVLLSGPVDEDTLRPLLAGPDAARRLWAADGLRRRDDHAGLPEAVRALRSGAVPERRTAARLLGGYVTDLSVPPLLDALADENVEVRGAAGEALARLLSNLFPYRVFDLRTTGWAPDADPATRGAAIATLRAWWDANRAADW